jgi:hypothetical protein
LPRARSQTPEKSGMDTAASSGAAREFDNGCPIPDEATVTANAVPALRRSSEFRVAHVMIAIAFP